jgi:hypothetical protein
VNEDLGNASELESQVKEMLLDTLATAGATLVDAEVQAVTRGLAGSPGPQGVGTALCPLIPGYVDLQVGKMMYTARKKLPPGAGPEQLADLVRAQHDPAVAELKESLGHAALVLVVQQDLPAAPRAKALLWHRLYHGYLLPLARALCRPRGPNGLEPDELCHEFYVKKFDYLLRKYEPKRAPLVALLKRAAPLFFTQLARSPNREVQSRPEDMEQEPADLAGDLLADDEQRRAEREAVGAVCRRLVEDGFPSVKMLAFRLHHFWGWKLERIQVLLGWTGRTRSLGAISRDIREAREVFARRFRELYPSLLA